MASIRGRWVRKQPDGSTHDGHTDAYEQMVMTAEQIAWTHEFSDGIVRDSGDALLEFMEFAIQWRTANGLPTSAFAGTPAGENAPQAPRKVPARKAARKTPAKKAAHRP
jgi:hypothetical protein